MMRLIPTGTELTDTCDYDAQCFYNTWLRLQHLASIGGKERSHFSRHSSLFASLLAPLPALSSTTPRHTLTQQHFHGICQHAAIASLIVNSKSLHHNNLIF
jgi:hypothetical protein